MATTKFLFLFLGVLFCLNCDSNPNPGSETTKLFFKIYFPTEKMIIQEIPFEASGVHNYPDDSHIWIILEDEIGNYFLQNGIVKFGADSTWYAQNIRPGRDISRLHAVSVNLKGHHQFQEMVDEARFHAFSKLPEGSRILATVQISTN